MKQNAHAKMRKSFRDNLGEIPEIIRAFRVHTLRFFPFSHRTSLDPADPFIERLDVRLLGEAAKRPAQEITS